MANYNRQIATAKRMIAKYGSKVIYNRIRDIETDPDKPWIPGGQDVQSKTIDAVFVNDSSTLAQTLAAFMAGTTIPEGRITVFIPDIGFEPSPKDTIVKDGVEYRFTGVGVLRPAEQIIMSSIGVAG